MCVSLIFLYLVISLKCLWWSVYFSHMSRYACIYLICFSHIYLSMMVFICLFYVFLQYIHVYLCLSNVCVSPLCLSLYLSNLFLSYVFVSAVCIHLMCLPFLALSSVNVWGSSCVCSHFTEIIVIIFFLSFIETSLNTSCLYCSVAYLENSAHY